MGDYTAHLCGRPMRTEALPAALTPPGVAILAGPFGSGKTEIAINLALQWAGRCTTYLADLDVVTPYFRSRDARAALTEAGVRVLSPGGQADVYDVPALPAETGSVLGDAGAGLIIDVGGQPHGAGVLVHWREALRARTAKLCLVVNPRRPGAESAGDVADLGTRISQAAGLPLAGLIANGNLGPATTAADVSAGMAQARQLEARLDVPIYVVCCALPPVEECEQLAEGLPVLGLSRYMRPAWEAPTET